MPILAHFVGSTRVSAALGLVAPDQLLSQILTSLAFTALGLILFAFAFWVMGRITPFSLRKELEEDQNVAIAIVMASVIIGIGMIVAAAVHG